MIVEIIAKYLSSAKRLVVPNLGTFIVKVPAQTILFSNLMKNDDGVLRGLLKNEGISELDAAALVDRFVFEVNYRLENSGVCALDGFGVLRSGANGTVTFTFDISAKGDVLDGDADERMAAHVAEIASAVEPIVEPKPEVKPVQEVEQPQAEDEDIISVVPRVEHVQVEPKVKPREEEREERRKASRRREQNDYVKGLRYGKGRKVVTGREGATSRKSSKGSVIITIAMIAALIAVLALAYGLYNDWRNQQYLYEGLYDEPQTLDTAPASAEEGVRNPDLDYITPKEN